MTQDTAAELMQEHPKPPKKRRSDAGIPRKPAAPVVQPVGGITEQQEERLRALVGDMVESQSACWTAEAKRQEAFNAYDAYMKSLATGGTRATT
jgi:hypothetical protein